MARDNFSLPGYDAWKTRAPEDEPGYWDDKEEPDDREDEENQFGCDFPETCLMPSFDHMRRECYTVEIVEEMYGKMEDAE